MDSSCGDLVNHKNEELTKLKVVSKIKQHKDMIGGDDSCQTLIVNKVLGTLINLKANPKFKLLETLCVKI